MSIVRVVAVLVGVVLAGVMFSAGGENSPPADPAGTTRPVASAPRAGGLSSEQKEELKAFAKANMPELYEQLLRLEKENPERARPLLMGIYRLYAQLQRYPAEARPAAIARHRANFAIYNLSRELRQATDPGQRARLADRLRGLLAEQFDQDLIVKKYEVERLAKQLADLKGEIEQRQHRRQRIIEENLNRLMNPETRPATARADEPRS
jgi:hypothetical protein